MGMIEIPLPLFGKKLFSSICVNRFKNKSQMRCLNDSSEVRSMKKGKAHQESVLAIAHQGLTPVFSLEESFLLTRNDFSKLRI
jgi:hypothetical protein